MINKYTFIFIGFLPFVTLQQAWGNTTNPTAPASTDSGSTDAGDYYFGLNGEKIQFRRKNQQFLRLESIREAREQKRLARINKNSRAAQSSQALRATMPSGFSRIQKHSWGKLDLVKANTPQASASARSNSSPALQQSPMAPIFANKDGRGEFLILPDILVSFESAAAATHHKSDMLDQFSMSVKNQLLFSETEFLLEFTSAVDDYAKVFKTTRDLMALPYIRWAEPNMLAKLESTATPDPNDSLFREQWGLYNWGLNGEFCDANTNLAADIDANDAWDLMNTLTLPAFPRYNANGNIVNVAGKGPVIAIVDDGVNYNHPDLTGNIWTNPAPDPSGNFGAGTNICIGDTHGCNFGDFYIYGGGTGRTYNRSGSDIATPSGGTVVPPLPKSNFGQFIDTHGTQVAGIAAAVRNNLTGISGSAYNAEILPVRLEFHDASMDCVSIVDSLSYAAKYADVIVNSWQLDSADAAVCSSSLNAKLISIASGDPNHKRGVKGTPILFASGNSAGGWQKISIPVPSPGVLHLTLHKDNPDANVPGENAVWIDNIKLPNQNIETISSSLPAGWTLENNGTSTAGGSIYNGCDSPTSSSNASAPAAGNHVLDGIGHSIKIESTPASPFDDSCSYLRIPNVTAGTLEFWVWVSVETLDATNLTEKELFRVYLLNNSQTIKIGEDLITRGTENRGINAEASIFHEQMAYPASNNSVIAVGSSNDARDTHYSVPLTKFVQTEERAYFSQYGNGNSDTENEISVLAPGTGIRTTTSAGGYGFLSGTSASTPLVAGIVANMLAVDPDLTFTEIKTFLEDGADEIGTNTGEYAYTGGFNKYYGHGRANAYKSVHLAAAASGNGYNLAGFPVPPLSQPELCTDPNPGAAGSILDYIPAIIAAALKNK